MADLTAKERVFVNEYLIDLDPKRAALEAGYSATMAASKAYQWVSNSKAKPHVFDAVEKAMAKRAMRTEVTADRVLNELAKLGFSDIRKAVKWGSRFVERPFEDAEPEGESLEPQPHGGALKRVRNSDDGTDAYYVTSVEMLDSAELDDDTAAAIAEVAQTKEGVRLKFHDKKGALVDIGRHLGMFTDKVELSGGVTVNIKRFSADRTT
jgi:phage terminase small subunit